MFVGTHTLSRSLARRTRAVSRTALPLQSVRIPVSLALMLVAAACGDVTAPGDSVLDGRKTKSQPPISSDTATTAPSSPTTSSISGASLYTAPGSHAARTASEWRLSRPADATSMDYIAAQPHARWLGNWTTDVRTAVSNYVVAASNAGRLPVLVAYNIPQRDCGSYSGGNGMTADAYRTWISNFASGIGDYRAVVILEPDALAGMDCLSATDRQLRTDLLRYAVQTLRAVAGAVVYLDAGHPRWHSASTMASRLTAAGIASAHGFSLNVSNFIGDAENIGYGEQLSSLVSGKRFVIDASRNGVGPTADSQWCNPAGRALGRSPTTSSGHALVDAYLWIKTPGESDGTCNGGTVAGSWMPEYALGLARVAGQ